MFWFWSLVVYAMVLLVVTVVVTLGRDRREPDHGGPMKTVKDHWLIDRWGGGPAE